MWIAKNDGLLKMKYDKIDLNWKALIEKAINYIEKNLDNKIEYEKVAMQAYSSEYHFQRMFSYITGYTLGEYIRNRRMYLSALDIMNGEKIIDVAFKYDYDNPDSFAKTFKIFHGVLPSEIKGKGAVIVEFPPLKLPEFHKTATGIIFRIKKIQTHKLIGFRKYFYGSPSGEAREIQEREFLKSTRAKQWILRGAASNIETEFLILSNITDKGYDFFVAYELDKYDIEDLYNPSVSGIDFIDKFGFEQIVVSEGLYAVFETSRQVKPVDAYLSLRKMILRENLLNKEYRILNRPELIQIHWRPIKGKKNRYIEICIPIEKIT